MAIVFIVSCSKLVLNCYLCRAWQFCIWLVNFSGFNCSDFCKRIHDTSLILTSRTTNQIHNYITCAKPHLPVMKSEIQNGLQGVFLPYFWPAWGPIFSSNSNCSYYSGSPNIQTYFGSLKKPQIMRFKTLYTTWVC